MDHQLQWSAEHKVVQGFKVQLDGEGQQIYILTVFLLPNISYSLGIEYIATTHIKQINMGVWHCLFVSHNSMKMDCVTDNNWATLQAMLGYQFRNEYIQIWDPENTGPWFGTISMACSSGKDEDSHGLSWSDKSDGFLWW